MFKISLRSFGTFWIFESLVSRNWLVIEWNGAKFWPHFVYIGYFWPLNVQSRPGVIQCISIFRQDYSHLRSTATYLVSKWLLDINLTSSYLVSGQAECQSPWASCFDILAHEYMYLLCVHSTRSTPPMTLPYFSTTYIRIHNFLSCTISLRATRDVRPKPVNINFTWQLWCQR